jgi:hypothetical protein
MKKSQRMPVKKYDLKTTKRTLMEAKLHGEKGKKLIHFIRKNKIRGLTQLEKAQYRIIENQFHIIFFKQNKMK